MLDRQIKRVDLQRLASRAILGAQIFAHSFTHSKVLAPCWRGFSIPIDSRHLVQSIENSSFRKLLLYPPELRGHFIMNNLQAVQNLPSQSLTANKVHSGPITEVGSKGARCEDEKVTIPTG
jgi:hypothetical protein